MMENGDSKLSYICYGLVPGGGPYPAWFVLSAEDRAGNYGGLVHACDFIVTEEGTILKSRFGGITIGDERNHEYMEKALQVWNLIGGAK